MKSNLAPHLAEEYLQRQESLPPHKVRLTCYKLDGTYYCTVDNIHQGDVIARGEGKTLRDAETAAMSAARTELDKNI
ncbi:MAG: hypothetical protein L0Y80_11405 [Ignavibacteriae bacterium]|nr:hypothetical protein [Ignavibacteriota bacterium]